MKNEEQAREIVKNVKCQMRGVSAGRERKRSEVGWMDV